MAEYVNNENTLGFYKFTDEANLLKNSITNDTLNLKYFRGIPTSSTAMNPDPLVNKINEKNKYKSRPSSFLLQNGEVTSVAGSRLSFSAKNIANSVTTEFWFYHQIIENIPSTPIPPNYEFGRFETAAYSNIIVKNETNPFLYTFSPIYNTTFMQYKRTASRLGGSGSSRVRYTYNCPIWVFLSYCELNKRFVIQTITHRLLMNNGSTTMNPIISRNIINNCPPNRWYHVAIVQYNRELMVFIDGKKKEDINFNSNYYNYLTTYGFENDIWESIPNFNAISSDMQDFEISIGNRSINEKALDTKNIHYGISHYMQNSIIDDLRITRGALYTEDFTPPGLIGKQILLYDDYAYYIDPDSQDLIKLSFSKWNDISDSDKLILLDRVGYDILPEVEQIKVIQTDPSKPVQYLNYQTDTVKPNIYIDKIDSSASQIVYPTKFFDYEAMQDYLVNITASGTTTSSSMVRLAVTRDGENYYTYNLSNNEWVPLDNKEDVLNNGIKLADLKDIPKSSWIQFDLSKFAFSIGLYRNADTSTCQIEDITLHLSLDSKWVKANTTTQSKYKYIGPTFLRVTFLEEGKYKINYNDRGGE